MSTKVVERVIKCCDFCIGEDVATWKCGKCGRDACANCGLNWSVQTETPQGPNFWSAVSWGGKTSPTLSAFFCNDCRSEVEMAFVRVGMIKRELAA